MTYEYIDVRLHVTVLVSRTTVFVYCLSKTSGL